MTEICFDWILYIVKRESNCEDAGNYLFNLFCIFLRIFLIKWQKYFQVFLLFKILRLLHIHCVFDCSRKIKVLKKLVEIVRYEK